MTQSIATCAALLLALSCHKGEAEPSPAAVTCEAYKAAFCEKAGADSEHCMALGNLVDLLPQQACAAGMAELPATALKLEAEKKPCRDLAERLCKDVGTETRSCASMRLRFPNFPAAQCAPSPEAYAKIVEDIKADEAKLLPLDAAKQAALLATPRASFGPVTAPVKVVEFSDFQCPFCAGGSKSVKELRSRFGDKVYFVFRQFPLDFHPDAHLAAEASLAAAAQGKFWEFHDRVFENQGRLHREHLEEYAKDVGLDVAKFKHALDAGTYKAAVDAELELGRSVNVDGTPTTFIDGKMVADLSDTPAVVAAVESALKR